ncbi:MAG: lipase family protein [Acidobacteriota bacterium]|nr:lipase family protein [Acidobacteriota bacterium]
MNLASAIQFGQVVDAAYAVPSDDLANRAGQFVQVGTGAAAASYEVVTSIYANDLATQMNPLRAQSIVSIGLVLQASKAGDAVIALRGTEGIMEWVQDARFLAVPCPFLPGAGNTEDGFTAMYNSLAISTASGSPSVIKALGTLAWRRPVTSLTVCGHSLGGALAVDLAAHAPPPFNTPEVYTYASPRTGDPTFASTYDHLVPNTSRIANRMDLVPNLPTPPLYEHVLGLFELNPIELGLPPKVLVKMTLPCEHALNTYLYLLSRAAGGNVIPLDASCVP